MAPKASKKPSNRGFAALTVAELRAKAKERGLRGYSTLKKDDLVALLRAGKSAAKKSSKSPAKKASKKSSKSPAKKSAAKRSSLGAGNAYCVVCKKGVAVKNKNYLSVKGPHGMRYRMAGECPLGHKVSKFVSEAEYNKNK